MIDRVADRAGLGDIAAKVERGERLDVADGVRLYETPAIHAVGLLANRVRERHNQGLAWWVRNQHINYTNICNKGCLFCSFYALPRDTDRGYVLSPDDVAEKVRAYLDIPITEIHVVGGVNPKLPYAYYLDLCRAIKSVRPAAVLKAFTMIEIEQIARIGKVGIDKALADLRDAGLDMLPGGGAEVFSERVHEELFWAKGDSLAWVDVARTAHRMGIKSNATLLYGHVEQTAEKVEHLLRLRQLQDETGGIQCFIPLSFHPEQTAIEHLPPPTGLADLREVAVARLMLDNVPHIKSFWIMNTIQVTQAALWYGADDTDGTIQEYEITRDPHTDRRQVLTSEQLRALITEAGREPVERDALYRRLDGVPAASPRHRGIDDIADRVFAGERLGEDDGRRLFAHPNLPELGALAHEARLRRNPEPVVTYVVGRNINYTNVCWVQCSFCAFYRLPSDRSGEAYTLSDAEIFEKIDELVAVGDDHGQVELLLQGGLNPKLKIDWYEGLFERIRDRYPTAWLHALSVTEILYIAKLSKLTVAETIGRLRAAGLGSIPGAGAEILDDRVRHAIAPHKETTAEWLEVMRLAHEQGLRTSATMMYGSTDTAEHRLQHLLRLRDLQDRTGGFTAFIPWSFQPDDTPLGAELGYQRASGFDYLRTCAVSRLMLDNIDHLQASWVTQGPKMAQIALHFGVDDFGSTMLEENVVSAAGTSYTECMPLREIRRLIEDAGFRAERRTTLYGRVQEAAALVGMG